ncbi:hypothetical protein [Oceanicoccus sp. KOV_DT_Chl]|uniref:PFGI-1 class ICE element type IV pilus protein PilL2 n=1 Tax=Oceanicoccus sp. KOV_DT_Chl TaxID=1904639 RepID=UPI000C7A9AC6|nr:hypothetical protein [Oceanicoccus sp. KOV_DT_Chl]
MREIDFGKLGVVLALVLFLSPCALAGIAESRTFESRYLSVQVGPEQAQTDLLQSIIEIRIPEKITTVGEALNYLLRPYGFQLDINPDSDEQYLLLMLALPEPHRGLGPMTLMEAVTTLGGHSFQALINPVKRTVRYQLREGFTQFATDTDSEKAKQQWLARKEVESVSSEELKIIAVEQQRYVPVLRGDSLSSIVNNLDLNGMTTDQSLVHLFRANPQAFANHNMNHLLAGEMLTIPPVEIEALPTAVESSQLVDEHYRLWKKRFWRQGEVAP